MVPNENEEKLLSRPPIVAVMGHVDHGKTTLLDYIRKANVAGKEAGGITQSIGAYEIRHQTSDIGDQKRITFIDTPGHEAFIKMRGRGASIADLAILAVAADEGVKPQTIESIKILHETKTPFVAAITKIDKPNADIEKVKNELTAAGVLLEGYGGHVSFEPVSAKTGQGVTELLDLILLAADVEHLTHDPDAPASGFILEAKTDRQRGITASILVKNGSLKHGDQIGTKTARGKVKILENFLGEPVKNLTPSAPGLVIGFETLPLVGEEFSTATSKTAPAPQASRAREMQDRIQSNFQEDGSESTPLRIILKAADLGSLEALAHVIQGATQGKPVEIVNQSAGDVVDNDVKFAISSGAVIVAFKSRTDKAAKTLAEANRVAILSSEIIYELVQEVEKFLKEREKPAAAGELEILAVFSQDKPGKQIVGGRVIAGAFRNKVPFEIVRGGNALGTGKVLNLQQQKKDAHEVREGNEAGLLVNSETLVNVGDRLVIKE